MTIVMALAGVAVAVAGCGLAGLAWQVRVQQRAIERVGERLGQLLTGLSILTDTTESGLHDLALEIERTAAVMTKPPRAVAARRISGAARRGHSVQDIAAAEQVSEGEVRLQLALARKAPRSRKAAVTEPAAAAPRAVARTRRAQVAHADVR